MTTNRTRFCAALVVGTLASVSAVLADGGVKHVITQQGREFRPGAVAIHVGDTLDIVNDDEGGIIHHAYVDGGDFTFDSGDQKPGERTEVAFTKLGTFDVLCAIHPKMRLAVTVK